MSWEIASLGVLGLGLLAGFAWYERSRPPARVLALVASLAALAVVGRVAFAALPNVQAASDIVFLSGYALGGAPGFAVGAVSAVVSNVFLSHGPWTPWQMAAWGGIGAAGAGLGWLCRGRELGRLPLALACGVAGLAFGAVMDVYVWTLGAEQTPAAYLAVAGTSLPFNVAHAVGNVAFCLLVGPSLVTALRRYRRRVDVRWPAPAPAPDGGGSVRTGARLAALAGALLLAGALSAPPAAEAGTGNAVRYLERAQNRDGGFGGDPGAGSSQLYTGWAALGLAAADRNPRDVAAGRRSALDFVRKGADALRSTGDISRTVLVVEASGRSARSFAGRDLVAQLKGRRRSDGSYDGLVNQTSFAILALRAAGAGGVGRSERWLADQQNRDGGFGFSGGSSSPEDTGYVLQALAVSGRRGSGTVRRALQYVERRQAANGGFGGNRTPVNAQATAFTVQGILAAGRNPESFTRNGKSPLDYIRSLQAGDGSIRYARGNGQTPVWVTSQALLALEREPFPIAAAPRAPGDDEPDRGRGGGGTGPAGGGAGTGAPTGGETAGGGLVGPGGGGLAGASTSGARERGDGKPGARRGGDGRGRERGGGGSSLLDGFPERIEESSPEPPAEAAEIEPERRGSVLASVIAAGSTALFVGGVRRRLRRRLAARVQAADETASSR